MLPRISFRPDEKDVRGKVLQWDALYNVRHASWNEQKSTEASGIREWLHDEITKTLSAVACPC